MNGYIKFITTAFLILITSLTYHGQSLLNGAESVAFDTLNNRYLVSSLNDQKIVAIDMDGNHSIYKTGIGAFGDW